MSEAPDAEVPAVEPAPDQAGETTDAHTGEDATPEGTDEGEGEQPKPKGGFQRRIAELVQARHEAARDRDYWRDL